MEDLFEEVQKRLDVVYGNDLELNSKDSEMKVFTVRLSVELLEQMDTIASILQTSKTEVARMIISHGVEGIVEKFKIKKGSGVGAPYSEIYDLETGSIDVKKKILEKWEQERQERENEKVEEEK